MLRSHTRRSARAEPSPVAAHLAGPGSDPQFMGMLGMHGTYQANMAMHNADLIIAIGARFDDRITNTPDLFAPNAKIIHFDVDQSSVSKIIEANIAVFGQVKNSLIELIKQLKDKTDLINGDLIKPWLEEINKWTELHGLNHELYKENSDTNMILPSFQKQSSYLQQSGFKPCNFVCMGSLSHLLC